MIFSGLTYPRLEIDSDVKHRLEVINLASDVARFGICPICGGAGSMSNKEHTVCVNGHTAPSNQFHQKKVIKVFTF